MNNLRKLRSEKGVSQQEVATYLKVSNQAYSNYENEKREADYETLVKMAEYFSVSVDRVLGRDKSNLYPTAEDIKYALFEGDDNVSDEAYEEVKRFAAYIKERHKNDRSE